MDRFRSPVPLLADMEPWLGIGLSQIFSQEHSWVSGPPPIQSAAQAFQQWQVAIAALNRFIEQQLTVQNADSSGAAIDPDALRGMILSAPAPVVGVPWVSQLLSWVFTPQTLTHQCLPSSLATDPSNDALAQTVPLFPSDPLLQEQFCLVLTSSFTAVLVLQINLDQPRFQFSFSPQTVEQAWQILRTRILLTRPSYQDWLDQLLSVFPPREPDSATITQFSQFLLEAATSANFPTQPTPTGPATLPLESETRAGIDRYPDVELLQAIAHEVRTPLATIKTLTQLLLKRRDLIPEVSKRLQAIERECNEQIDRFSLIFRAAELETTLKPTRTALTSTSLAEIFQEGIPRWQKQAARYSLNLEVLLPPRLPAVISDPTLLDQVLSGLIEHMTHTLPRGSRMQVQVTVAGEQLKLQLRSPYAVASYNPDCPHSPLKSLGQVLMLQPETGNLSLSLPVAKNLFQILGGKLTVRHRPHQGEILTLFLPLGRDGAGA